MTARSLLLGLVAALAAAVCPAAATAAAPQVNAFDVTPSTLVAGAHPDLDVHVGLATRSYANPSAEGGQSVAPAELARRVTVDLPPGLLANATSFATCTDDTIAGNASTCPVTSQVGTMTLRDTYPEPNAAQTALLPYGTNTIPIINMTPFPGEVARFGIPFVNGGVVIHLDIRVRDASDFGVVAQIDDIPSALAFFDARVDLWGVPSSATHDAQRLPCFDINENNFTAGCTQSVSGTQTFMVNPTSCTPAPATADVDAAFYGDPSDSRAAAQVGPFTGCAALPFAPSLGVSPDNATAGQPAGYGVQLAVPQAATGDTTGATTAHVRDVSVTLPDGTALSPGVANGLSACGDAQFALGSRADETCPASSQIGTVTVHSPLLSDSLTGAVFVGQQESSDPASGRMYRLFLAADDGDRVHLKLVGSVAADPSTGRLTATFAQNPQVPFDDLRLSLKGGARAALVNPAGCGTATSSWTMSSWANPAAPATGQSSFAVGGDCTSASQFTPALEAGLQSNRAGASSPLQFTVTRPDGQQAISGLPTVTLPPGLTATLSDVPPCADASAAAGTCPAASRVGSATVVAGAGAQPFALGGQPVYLTGPYRGAPYGLAVAVHALAGPFDLGAVVVRQAIDVDPTTAQVTIHSDPLPTILGGVPLDLRSISLSIDRPGFIRSPTSCAAKAIRADVTGAPVGAAAAVAPGTSAGFATSAASSAHLVAPLQMGHCDALRFTPRLGISLAATHRTTPGSHPRLTASLTQPGGQANLRSARVALPLSLALDPDNSEHVCSVKAAARIACPSKTIVGSATADTPILPHPLTAKVYLVQGIRYDARHRAHKTLPSLLVPLRGPDGVAIDVTAKTSVDSRNRLVTTFPAIPDAAISRFTLAVTGGRRGILVVTGSRSLCTSSRAGDVTERGQNGMRHEGAFTVAVGRACRRS